MKSKILTLIILTIFITSCDKTNDKNTLKTGLISHNLEQELESYSLLKHNCYACHSVTSTSHDAIIAPPMVAVKRRYKMNFSSREDFIEAIVNWAKDPDEKAALMYGAVQQFKVMPKQDFDEAELYEIAAYIYDNEIEQPDWFEEHFNLEQQNRGRGKGRRRGM